MAVVIGAGITVAARFDHMTKRGFYTGFAVLSFFLVVIVFLGSTNALFSPHRGLPGDRRHQG
jgi:hypothetical protein